MTTRILRGDCRDVLATLPAESVHCVITSPPYWGLRDYGIPATVWDGEAACEHVWGDNIETVGGGKQPSEKVRWQHDIDSRPHGHEKAISGAFCQHCGAWRGAHGLEPTIDLYVRHAVEVFRVVRRVLRADGTLWLDLGDSYASGEIGRHDGDRTYARKSFGDRQQQRLRTGLKPKDLCGIPWRVAFALQADGWVLRQDIIWSKPNPMPESVTDRCTKSHENLFLFSKAIWNGPQNGRFSDISDEDARWLALCIDTEGCIVVKRVKQNDGGADSFGPQVTFGGTNRALIDRFVGIVGHGNIATRAGKNAPMFYWQIGNNIARDLLHRIYPYLIVKQRQARIAIYVDDLVYYRGGKMLSRKQRTDAENKQLLSLWARNKLCNQFGDPEISDVPEPKYGRWTGSPRYFYDAEAIREPQSDGTHERFGKDPRPSSKRKLAEPGSNTKVNSSFDAAMTTMIQPDGYRNRRSVWEIASYPFSEAHFATFPPDLVEPCIKAGTSQKGCCAQCGVPWVRQTKRTFTPTRETAAIVRDASNQKPMDASNSWGGFARGTTAIETTDWQPGCTCVGAETKPCTVLDPFSGAGTVGLVADRLQRDAILIELNPDYADMAERRITGDAPLFADVEVAQ